MILKLFSSTPVVGYTCTIHYVLRFITIEFDILLFQIVGHGRDTNFQMRLSEKTPTELAEIVRKLPIESSELGRVSLVGCNVGKSGQSEFLNDGFTEKFLKSLRSDQNIRTEISSRNGLISVSATGKKETGEITADGIQWFSKDPLSKTVVTLGDFDEVIRAELPLTDRVPTYNQESSGSLVKLFDVKTNVHPRDSIEPIYIKKSKNTESGEVELIKKINYEDIGELINSATKRTFLEDVAFVRKNIIERQSNFELIKNKILSTLKGDVTPETDLITENLRKNTIKRQGRVSHNEFTGKAYLKDKVTNKQISKSFQFTIQFDETGNLQMDLGNIRPFLLDSGIPPNWKYVARLNGALERVINVENVRTIQSRADFIYEINMLGTFGVDYRNGESLRRYYRFGDVVYRMARNNFYIKWEGMIASDNEVRTEHLSQSQVNENDILNLKTWRWLDRQNRYIYPKDFDYERYTDMRDKIEANYAEEVINQEINLWKQDGFDGVREQGNRRRYGWDDVSFTLVDRNWNKNYRLQHDSGNVLKLMGFAIHGDHIAIEKNSIHVLEGSTVLAIGLSECVRNFRTFYINEMLMNLNTQEHISLARLIEAHPMTRGNSWGFVGETGLDVTLRGYKMKQLEVVLPRELNIARVYLLSRQGHDEKNNYKFLTESDYNQIEKSMPAGELAKITYPVGTDDIHNTIMDFRPEITDATVRTKPLGGMKIQTMNDLGVLSDISMGKALPIRASISLANDYIIISNHVSKAVAHVSKTSGTEFEIIESSIKVEDNNIRMTLRDRSHPLLEQEINVPIDEDLLTSKKMKEEAVQRLENIQETRNIPSKSLTTVNEFLGVYGIVMGFRGAIQCFEDGKTFEGIVNVAQSLHGIYGMSQTAQRAFKMISSKFFSSGLQQVERSLSTATTEISTALTEGTTAAEESLTVAGEAAEDIPVLGTVFGVYNTIQDIRRGTAIGYVDAALDAAITISALFGPEALVVTVALTIVRLVIDDFYYAISNELKNLPADATVLQKIGAVFKGIAEGIVMVIKNIVDFFTLGFLSFAETSSKIDEQFAKDHALLKKMSDFHNYFKIEKEEGSHEKLIDFAAGEESWNGGNIVFRLYDDGTAKLRMQIVDDSGREKTFEKRIQLEDGASDIVLGIGESHDFSFKKQSAKIFWFIPVHSKYLINEVRGERDSLHGTYYGNSNNNKFFAIQKLPDDVHLDYSLTDYFYEIYGEDGDDIFYLGPQRSVVSGGNGHDTYIIPSSGGRTVINNYADDLLEDVLFVQVDFEQLYVDRIQSDLILKHGHDHDITVRNWFSGHRMGHLTFKANNGVIFNVTIGVYGQAFTKPVAVLLTGDKEKHTIDVSKGKWKNVMVITGSDASDDIIANAHDNLLDGGKGYNTIQGGAGSDTYIVKSVDISELSDWNVINNFDPKMTVDKVIFDVPFQTLSANFQGKDILLMASSSNGPKVKLENWISSEHYRHMVFVSSDDVIFKLADDIHDPDLIQPIILDASKEKTGVKLDASSEKFVNVSTIIGSDYNDKIIGNIGNNYLKGGKGSDFVSGGDGRDVYVIGQHDTGDIIDNFSEDKKDDLILADFNYNDIRVFKLNNDAVFEISGNRIVTIVDWVKGENWRHLTIRTIDGISFKLEEDSRVGLRKYPIEIDKSGKSERQNIKTHTRSMRSVEHIIGSNATDYLAGNQLANRIDPGFGGAYMMALGGHDQYVIKDHYEGPNIINNFARDNLTDTVKFPAFFSDITTSVSGDDIIISSHYNPNTAVTLQKYKTDSDRRHIVINTVKDGIVFTIPPSRDFLPTPVSIDRTNQAHNLIVDLNSNTSWDNVITVVGTKDYSNVIRGNHNNNTITGGKLSDMLSGGYGNDVIRGDEGEDFIDGGDGL